MGDRAGGVGTWQMLQRTGNRVRRLTQIHAFPLHRGAVTAFARSRRDKGFITADASGIVRLHYGTTGQTTLLSVRMGGPGRLSSVVFAPKADGLLALDDRGSVSHWELKKPHPEITLRSLFGRLWYEGYPGPEYVWQSTGGTDDFEAKFSLTPLIYGTLKGTFYALLLAVPLALASALYVSQFMHPRLKGIVKPTVEIMAALPSVLLGFIAGLWLAPMVERVVPGIFLMPVVIPLLILAMARAAGEVAPLMITGVVKLALALPVDGFWPFLHLDRKFMHLGFHIYDVGFQSPNVDAARPMVYTTTLLLLLIVITLNLTAIALRNRLRKRYAVSGL